ncbi:VOC family protein [Vibrio sp. V27_P1S3P104]|uniref:VOC family protein n=1 Tax=Vibrio TaxID=662 RepID=UPI000C16F32B|nr:MULTISPECIES: VOC family protein [Vibrio]NAW68351.1 VOC family protein [Vibrio sp. V28_P6S34P95]NAX04759.1 VOC family protein [Vibrio sp. V30_P3S12P165]NAX33945.1 VOC family protein [Vibrio sp. V29_P1S30P107]NAX35969.1 VOC family protein [Vibrio sp. V27_P1S3P104]NAX39275.1 VOC family protein [Vibrio sp. V26_P1S5P106]
MLTIHGLDHVVLRTTKLEKMLDFYCTVLGCQIERVLPEELGLTQLRAGSALIDLVTVNSELGQEGGKPPQQDGRNVDHLCLQISPLAEAALIHYLDHHQIPHSGFAKRYGAQGFGRSIYIEDPEGNVIELKPLNPE